TLLIVAGLFLRSLLKVTQVDPGFEPHGVVTASFDTELLGYTASRRHTFITEFLRRASSMPGVISAAVTNIVPLGGEFDGAARGGGGKTPRGPSGPRQQVSRRRISKRCACRFVAGVNSAVRM